MPEQLIYRKLPVAEWGRLKPLFSYLDAFLPDALAASAAIVENTEKRIVGFNMFQLVAHAEPMWQDPDYRGQINFKRLHSLIFPNDLSSSLIAPGAMIVATNETIERMAEIAGYTRLPGTVWVKDLRNKTVS